MTTITYEGMNCEAVLDPAAGTLTLTHGGGITVPKHKKESSPWVIPLGAISDVEFQEKTMLARGWVRIVLTDRTGWDKTQMYDVNAFFAGKEKVTPFVDAINQARAGATPAVMTQQVEETRTQRWAREAEESKTAKGRTFQGLYVGPETITADGQSYPLAGAKATVDIGAERKRITAARVVAVGVFALAAKKNESKVYLTVDLADGQTLVAEASHKEEKEARDFAAFINSSSARLTTQTPAQPAAPAVPAPGTPPPPPPAVPAGWYPDQQNPGLQRYWDGAKWTEHTAPESPTQ